MNYNEFRTAYKAARRGQQNEVSELVEKVSRLMFINNVFYTNRQLLSACWAQYKHEKK
jgi:uncharacterized protein YlbG (UPF0298 family)